MDEACASFETGWLLQRLILQVWPSTYQEHQELEQAKRQQRQAQERITDSLKMREKNFQQTVGRLKRLPLCC